MDENKKEKINDKTSLRLYFSFLREEIPGVLQIITFIGFPGILLDNVIISLIISVVLPFLLWQYLARKMFLFLKLQIVDPYSEMNRHKIPVEFILKRWEKYIIISAVISGIFIGALPHILRI